MVDLILAAADLQAKLDRLSLPNCVIGGLALQVWGEPRLTRDIDFNVITGFGDEAEKIYQVLPLIKPRVNDALPFAIEHRVILGLTAEAIPVDIALGGFDYERRMVGRAVSLELATLVWVRVCSAEDLIVMKAFAGRDQDWVDISGVLHRTLHLDWPLIEFELSGLLELVEDVEPLKKLRDMRESHRRGGQGS